MATENGKYEFSEEGINAYYRNAISKVNATNKEFQLIEDLTEVSSLFEENEEKEYHHVLSEIKDNKGQYEFWHKRLKHVRTALLFVYNSIFEESSNNTSNNTSNIELGIFGSESVSSDIDIGVSYKKGTKIMGVEKSMNDPFILLSDVVKKFEEYFVKKDYTSLDIDVEMYADYFISPTNGTPFIAMNENIYNECLPYILAGMLKNRIQANYDNGTLTCDVRRVIHYIKNNLCTLDKNEKQIQINNLIDNIQLDSDVRFVINKVMANDDNQKKLVTIVEKTVGNRGMYNESKEIIKGYMKLDYKDSCEEYYRLLNIAHDTYSQYFQEQDDTKKEQDDTKKEQDDTTKEQDDTKKEQDDTKKEQDDTKKEQDDTKKEQDDTKKEQDDTTKEQDDTKKEQDDTKKEQDDTTKESILIALNKSISHALVYRAESYLSAPTIYHVVYTMQAMTNTENESEKKRLIEMISSFGYEISILEQLGYITRFYKHYCDNSTETNDCTNQKWLKKKNKYISRLKDALSHINNGTIGGKRVTRNKRRSQNKNKKGKSKKNKNKKGKSKKNKNKKGKSKKNKRKTK